MNPINNFRDTPFLVKGVVVIGIITIVALATITATCIYLNTGSLLPFDSLGVIGTIGLGSSMGIIIIGVMALLAIVIVSIVSYVREMKEHRASHRMSVARKQELQVQAAKAQAQKEENQQVIWRDLQSMYQCTSFQEVQPRNERDFIIPANGDQPEIRIFDSVKCMTGIGYRHDEEHGGRTQMTTSLRQGSYIIQSDKIRGGAYVVYQNSLGIFFFYYPGYQQQYKTVEEQANNLSGL